VGSSDRCDDQTGLARSPVVGEPGRVRISRRVAMWRPIARLVGGLLLALTATGIVFVVGMRTKSPLVLDTVRRTSRAMKPLALKSAGTPGAYASVIRHVGRTTGRPYETPVGAVATDDGFAIALPYGSNTDWLKNVLASGSATIVNDGNAHRVDQPEVVPIAEGASLFPPNDRRTLRFFGVEQCLRVRLSASMTG
jgi:deazaflavin-dependent oxidoreductase (nitroreductase family)